MTAHHSCALQLADSTQITEQIQIFIQYIHLGLAMDRMTGLGQAHRLSLDKFEILGAIDASNDLLLFGMDTPLPASHQFCILKAV